MSAGKARLPLSVYDRKFDKHFSSQKLFIRSFACSYTETIKPFINKDKEVLGMIARESEALENKLDAYQQGIAYTQLILFRDTVTE